MDRTMLDLALLVVSSLGTVAAFLGRRAVGQADAKLDRIEQATIAHGVTLAVHTEKLDDLARRTEGAEENVGRIERDGCARARANGKAACLA